MKPNIILLMSDQQRWDSLGCNGNSFVCTPHIDRLAAEGARFVNSFTPWPVCTPARATMWTGLYPNEHGLTYNIYGFDDALSEVCGGKTTVFEMLRKSGYNTAYFGKWHLGDQDPGMFDVWDGFNSQGGHWIDGIRDGRYKPDSQTDQLIEHLKQRKSAGGPFIAVNGYYPPHTPYTAPKRFYEHYRGRGVPFAGYYASVSAIDDNVGRVMQALEDLDLAENTVVVYLSDHGDTFRYRVQGTHKFVCHDEAIRIPLIVRWPGQIEAETVLEQTVGLEDLMPTILEWAGLTVPDHLHGRSLGPLLEGRDVEWRQAYYVQNIIRHGNLEQRCIRTDKWKLILSKIPGTAISYANPNFLYDLENDPEEELNVYDTPRADSQNQYGHFPPYTEKIRELAGLAREFAEKIGDGFGVVLADSCLLEVKKRKLEMEKQKPTANAD